MFCSATCSKNSCADTNFDKCYGCPTGLAKSFAFWGWFPTPSQCIAASYFNTSAGAKYVPIGKTNDINYDLKSSTTVETLTTTPISTATCSNGSPIYNYQYYGDLFNTDTLKITHPGIIDPKIRFWKVNYIIINLDQNQRRSNFNR